MDTFHFISNLIEIEEKMQEWLSDYSIEKMENVDEGEHKSFVEKMEKCRMDLIELLEVL